MKNTSNTTSQSRPFAGRTFAKLLVLGVALHSSDLRVAADPFPSTPQNESIISMGVFQVKLTDPKMIKLMEQGSFTYQYMGWDPVGKTVTSPVLIEGNTKIGVSGAHQREVLIAPPYFPGPVHIGLTTGTGTWPTDLTEGLISDYNDYVYPLSIFNFQAIPGADPGPPGGEGPNEVLTEIQSFSLTIVSNCNSGTTAPIGQAPPADPAFLGKTLVRAGRDNSFNGAGGAGTPIPNYLRRSIGMVQSSVAPAPATPHSSDTTLAHSFFDMTVEVTLPQIPNSASFTAFPLWGAVLTNDQPLIILAEGITTWPPSVVYTHSGTSANQPFSVDLKFRDTSPNIDPSTSQPWFSAGEVFGTIVLAGHGLLDPCVKDNANMVEFVNKVFGPPGERAPGALVGRTFPDASYPSANSYFSSALGTNFTGGSVDCVRFTNGPTVRTARNFQIMGLVSPISLPSPGNSVVYSNANASITFEISDNGTNFIGAQGSGPMSILIVNTNSPSSGITNYYQELQVLNITGTSGLGTVKLRESPTKNSVGKEVIQDKGAGTFKIGGYIDASLEYSFNSGITYQPASRPIRLEQTVPVCGDSGLITASLSGSAVVLSWPGSTFRLQGTASLTPIIWVDLPGSSPYNVTAGSPYHYFRLVCP